MNKRIILSALMGGIMMTASAQSLTPMFKDVDCGQILFRNETPITIELRNNTTAAVRIKEVDTGCGCTVAEYDEGEIMPGRTTKVRLVFDGKQLGHFNRVVRITDTSSDEAAEVLVSGQVVTKLVNYSGEYPCKLGSLLTDVDNIEFDDVNQGHRMVKELHIMNPTGQNVQPTALRLPPYLSVTTHPKVIGPKQKGVMSVTLQSKNLRDYGLTQTSIYLGKNPADKVAADKEITVSAVLLPPAVAKDDASRRQAPRIVMSSQEIDMTALARKSKVKGEIEIKNDGHSTLKISKLQMLTMGLEVELDKSTIEPGETARLKVTGQAKVLRKEKSRLCIIMFTNVPDCQKVEILIKK